MGLPTDTKTLPALSLQGLADQMQALQNHFHDCSSACHTQVAFVMYELKQEMRDLQLAVHATQQGLETERTVLEKSRLEVQTQLAALITQVDKQAASISQPTGVAQPPEPPVRNAEVHEPLLATLTQWREQHAHDLQKLTAQVACLQGKIDGLPAPQVTAPNAQLHALAGQVQQWASHMQDVRDEISTHCQQAVDEGVGAMDQLLAQQTEALRRAAANDMQGIQKQLAQISADLRDLSVQLHREPSEVADKENSVSDPYMTPTTPPLQELASTNSSPASSQKREQYTATMSSLQHKNNILQGRIQQLTQKNEELRHALRLARGR